MPEVRRPITLSIVILVLIMAVVYGALLLLKPTDEPLWLDMLIILFAVAIIALSANRLFKHVWIQRPVTMHIMRLVLINAVIYGLASINAPMWIYIIMIAGMLTYALVNPRLRYWPNDPPNKSGNLKH